MGKRLRVGVVFGGRSGEHEVSLMSAVSVLEAIDPDRFEVLEIGITKEGHWLAGPGVMEFLKTGSRGEKVQPVGLLADPSFKGLVQVRQGGPMSRDAVIPVDVFFPVLHGPYGEDGTIQGLFEMANLPYVGAGVMASSVGMDKAVMKAVFRDCGLPVVDYVVIKRKEWENNPQLVVKQLEDRLGYPCFVKPVNLGSSVGITKAHSPSELEKALEVAARYDRKILVEKAVEQAREIECSVLGNDEPQASILGEIVPCNEFYDYRAKYVDGDSELIIPAPLQPEVERQVRQLAVKAFQAVDCAGMARVDFFVTRGDNRVIVNEINTIPGFTEISMYPKLWEASGISYRELITRLIDLALERYRDKNRSQTSYSAE